MATDWQIGLAAHHLNCGGVVAYPTEGVWGLGCLPDDEQAVARILGLKQRSRTRGLLLVAADISQFAAYLTDITAAQYGRLSEDWPGPVTYLVPDNGEAPDWIVGTHKTVGLRVSDHPLVCSLCRQIGPIVSTSANINGHPAALNALQVRQSFGDLLDMIVPGNLGGQSGPSRIKLLETGEIIR